MHTNTHRMEERAALDAVLYRCGLDIDNESADKLLTHLKLVIDKNKQLNLTRIDTLEEALILHLEDSLAVFPEFMSKDGAFCDIGTGAGFPGIPLALISQRNGILIDSVQKKARAVQEFIDQLELGNQIHAEGIRSEELALRENKYESIILRAVSSLPVIIELATPLLNMHGQLVAMKAVESHEDLKSAESVAIKCGLELVSQRNYVIGVNGEYERNVYVFERIADSSIKLPRRPGMATKRPLK